MYVIVSEVRDRVKLLTSSSLTDTQIEKFIIDAESLINLHLSDLYITPVRKSTYLTGTISGSANGTTITGTNTTFTTDLKKYDHIRIVSTGEVLVVSAVNNDTSLTVSTITTALSGSSFFVIPEEICTAVRYKAAQLCLDYKFNEQAYNQETEKPISQYDEFSKAILKKIMTGSYYNSELDGQVSDKTQARYIDIVTSDFKTAKEDFIDTVSTWWT